MSNDSVIITYKKHGKHKPHGGAWKVAFADFTLALMAFFLVLWLMQVASEEERELIIQYVQEGIPSEDLDIYFSPNLSFIEFESAGGGRQYGEGRAAYQGTDDTAKSRKNPIEDESLGSSGQGKGTPWLTDDPKQGEALKLRLSQLLEQAQAAKHLKMEAQADGLRIVLSDHVSQFMFQRGSAELEPLFQDILLSMGELLSSIENRLIVSGHTDASMYADPNGNWILSTQRALEARRALEFGGIPPKRFLNVAGYADTMPLDPDKPNALANRRVEIFILFKEAADRIALSHRFSDETKQASKMATDNQPRALYQ